VKRDGGYNYFSTDLASLWLVFWISSRHLWCDSHEYSNSIII
jgi:hypothetical protein